MYNFVYTYVRSLNSLINIRLNCNLLQMIFVMAQLQESIEKNMA